MGSLAAAPVAKEAVVSRRGGNPRFEDNGLELGLRGPVRVPVVVDPAKSHP